MTIHLGRRALVTAAGAGIGRAIAERLRDNGWEVLAVDIDSAALADLRGPGISVATADLRDSEAIGDLWADAGRVDALVNCAGVVHHGSILEASEEDLATAIKLNITAVFRLCRLAVGSIRAEGRGGSIVNIASVVSSLTGAPSRCLYGMTKAAVVGLTKSIAADFVADDIRCNAICPGTIDTPSLRGRLAAQPDPEAAEQAFLARQPMGRFGRPGEIAGLAAYLVSDDGGFATGQTYIVDGGWLT